MGTPVKNSKVGGKPIIRAWESFTGWYWLAVEESHKQDSVIDGKVYKDDQIYFGYVVGDFKEWGYFSLAELELSKPLVWEVKKHDIESIEIEA